MPVEIRELILRTTVVNGTNQGNQADSGSSDSSTESKDEIIAACTAQVLKILKREKER